MDSNNLSYIATNLDELMLSARPEVQELISGKDVDEAVAILGKMHRLPIGSYLALDNIILFTLLGALQPQDVLRAIKDILKLSEEDAYKLAQDLDKTILEKARIKIFDKEPKDMVTLSFQEGRSPDELRKEILDTTKRESGLVKEQASQAPNTSTVPEKNAPQTGTRSQLMEQLQILGQIPDDEEVANRLKKIQEQVTQIQEKEKAQKPAVAAENGEEESSIKIAIPLVRSATYSRAPTKYNVDPYREVSEE